VTKRDFKDLAIETLADSEAELLDRVARLEAEIGSWRMLVFAGLDAAAHLQLDLVQARATIQQLRAKIQELRAAARPQEAAAA
jgi:hypothetical protein